MKSSFLLSGISSNLRDRPFNLEFAVTYQCNLRCIQCDIWKYYDDPAKAKRELTIDEVDKIFRSYRGFKVVGITGGEPYLRDDLEELVETVIRTQPKLRRLFITSNGQLSQKVVDTACNIVKKIKTTKSEVELTHLISLDGPREVHDEIRGVKGAYDRAIKTINLLWELRKSQGLPQLGTVTVCSPFNITRFDSVIQEVERLKEKYDLEPSFCVWILGQLYKNTSKKIDVNDFREKIIYYIPKIKRTVEKSGSSLSRGRSLFYDLLAKWLENPTKQIIPCGGAKARYFLDPLGNVYPCTVFNARIGSLRDYSYDFVKVFKDENRRRVRRFVANEECPICCNTCETIPAMMTYPVHVLAKVIGA
jgi:radical SAM protein with 4Fe4S-binding SPASM domain